MLQRRGSQASSRRPFSPDEIPLPSLIVRKDLLRGSALGTSPARPGGFPLSSYLQAIASFFAILGIDDPPPKSQKFRSNRSSEEGTWISFFFLKGRRGILPHDRVGIRIRLPPSSFTTPLKIFIESPFRPARCGGVEAPLPSLSTAVQNIASPP